MAIDKYVMNEAKTKFSDRYSKQIKDLGFHLVVGIGLMPSTLTARIQGNSLKEFTREAKQQVSSIIKPTFTYGGYEIPVEVQYMGQIKIDSPES